LEAVLNDPSNGMGWRDYLRSAQLLRLMDEEVIAYKALVRRNGFTAEHNGTFWRK
jgi:hypothetical protein